MTALRTKERASKQMRAYARKPRTIGAIRNHAGGKNPHGSEFAARTRNPLLRPFRPCQYRKHVSVRRPPVPMLHVVLFQPEIPPNTGNIMRLCANTGARLHLVEPLGFELDDAKLRRAGLDYGDWSHVCVHTDMDAALAALPSATLWALTTKGDLKFSDVRYGEDDILLFGPETRGLPPEVLERVAPQQRLRVPMRPGSRSLNLSNAVAVVVYEAWRQRGYAGAV